MGMGSGRAETAAVPAAWAPGPGAAPRVLRAWRPGRPRSRPAPGRPNQPRPGCRSSTSFWRARREGEAPAEPRAWARPEPRPPATRPPGNRYGPVQLALVSPGRGWRIRPRNRRPGCSISRNEPVSGAGLYTRNVRIAPSVAALSSGPMNLVSRSRKSGRAAHFAIWLAFRKNAPACGFRAPEHDAHPHHLRLERRLHGHVLVRGSRLRADRAVHIRLVDDAVAGHLEPVRHEQGLVPEPAANQRA